MNVPRLRAKILLQVAEERERQTAAHGERTHLPDGTGPRLTPVWWGQGVLPADRERAAVDLTRRCGRAAEAGRVTMEHVLTEEWAEAIAAADPAALRAELVQVAAVAVQWVEALDRACPGDPDAQHGPHRWAECERCGAAPVPDTGAGSDYEGSHWCQRCLVAADDRPSQPVVGLPGGRVGRPV